MANPTAIGAKLRRQEQRLAARLAQRFASNVPERIGAAAGRNLVTINGQLYPAEGVDGQGGALRLVNIGTPAVARYAPAQRKSVVAARGTGVASGGSSGGGGRDYYAGTAIIIDAAGYIHVNVPELADTERGIIGNLNNRLGVRLKSPGGLVFEDGQVALSDAVAGAGLVMTNKVMAVGAGLGIDVTENAVAVKLQPDSGLRLDGTGLAMGDPGTLDWLTTSSRVGLTHYHAIDTSADVGSAPEKIAAKILRSTDQGGLTLHSLNVSGAAHVGGDLFVGTNESLRVIYHPAGTHGNETGHVHLIVNPTDSWTLDEQFGVDIDDNLLVRGWIVGKHALQIPGALMICHFDGSERFETDFTGSPTGHMGQAPTVYGGGVIYREGKFGKAVQLAESTTNLIRNPSFEVNLDTWSDYATGSATGTRTRASGSAKYGHYSLALSKSGGAANDRWGVSTSFPVTAGQQYTISFWIWSSGLGNARLVMEASNPGLVVYAPITGAVAEWRRIERTFTANATGNAHLYLYIDQGNGHCWIDAVQAEQKPYATPYADGSLGGGELGNGHTWSGTAHASTSTRPNGLLQYPATDQVLKTDKGTVMAWVRHEVSGGTSTVIEASDSGFASYVILRRIADGRIEGRWGTAILYSDTVIPDHEWHHYAITYDGTSEPDAVKLYVDGRLERTGSGTFFILQRVPIGYGAGSVRFLNGLLDDLVIVDRALDGDEIRAVYESNAPVFAETSSFHWRAGRNRFWADSEGIWMFSANNGPMFGAYAGSETDPNATKNWGGRDLGEGDILIGNYGNGNYLWWDADAEVLHVSGDLVVESQGVTESYVNQRRVLAINANFVPSNGQFTWAQFTVRLGDGTSRTVAAGSHSHGSTGRFYHYISLSDTGNLTLNATSSLTALGTNHVLIAVSDYRTANKPPSVVTVAGGTWISGDSIVTGTIKAHHIESGSITTDHIHASGISATKINADTLDAITSRTGHLSLTSTAALPTGSVATDAKTPGNENPGAFLGQWGSTVAVFEVVGQGATAADRDYIRWNGSKFSVRSAQAIEFTYRGTAGQPVNILSAHADGHTGILRFGPASSIGGVGNTFTLDASLTPQSNNSYNLGNPSRIWANVYADHVQAVTRVLLSSNAIFQTNPGSIIRGHNGSGTTETYQSFQASGDWSGTIYWFRFANITHMYGKLYRGSATSGTISENVPAAARPWQEVYAPAFWNGQKAVYLTLSGSTLKATGTQFDEMGNLVFNFIYLN